MATLEKIRNRAGVLVAVIIGIALLAFILGDFLNSGRTLFSSSQFEIAEISGKSIPYQKYQKEINDITEITKFTSGQSTIDEASMMQIREQTFYQSRNRAGKYTSNYSFPKILRSGPNRAAKNILVIYWRPTGTRSYVFEIYKPY